MINLKKIKNISFNGYIAFGVTLAVFCGLLFQPDKGAEGIKNGLELLGAVVIPSLFPFAVLCAYAARSSFGTAAEKVFGKAAAVLFKTGGSSAAVFLFGVTGGYPIGAKTALTMFEQRSLCADDARRLCLFCVNAGPAFAVSAVGVSMLASFKSGMILYVSELLSAFTLGFFCRFLKSETENEVVTRYTGSGSAFTEAVADGSRAIINICAWVLTFSCASALCELLPLDGFTVDFIKAVLEVTTGCAYFSGRAPLPVIAAMLGFGGISVICQVMPYLQALGVSKKLFFASRAVNAALNAFFASVLVGIFPQETAAFAPAAAGATVFHLSYGTPACIILIILCILFILDVDYNKKVC